MIEKLRVITVLWFRAVIAIAWSSFLFSFFYISIPCLKTKTGFLIWVVFVVVGIMITFWKSLFLSKKIFWLAGAVILNFTIGSFVSGKGQECSMPRSVQ